MQIEVHIKLKKLGKSNSSSHLFKMEKSGLLSLSIYRKVASSRLSQLVAHFNTVYEGEF